MLDEKTLQSKIYSIEKNNFITEVLHLKVFFHSMVKYAKIALPSLLQKTACINNETRTTAKTKINFTLHLHEGVNLSPNTRIMFTKSSNLFRRTMLKHLQLKEDNLKMTIRTQL